MNRNQFEDRHRLLNLQQQELDRKWRLYLREQEEREIMESFIMTQKSSSSTMGGAGGGSNAEETVNALLLTFDDIVNADLLVGEASSVEDWNTFFDLPAYGNAFIGVNVIGNTVQLFGGSDIIIKESLFDLPSGYETFLISVDDQAGCIIEVEYDGFGGDVNNGCTKLEYVNLPSLQIAGDYAFNYAGSNGTIPNTPIIIFNLPNLTSAGIECFFGCTTLNSINLPNLINLGAGSFAICEALTVINLPNLINLGSSSGNNNVFNSITGNTITATFNSALATNNAGNPDGDIQYLEANNTVTVTYV